MSRVAIPAFDGVVLFDLSVPLEVFGRTRVRGQPAYEVQVCAADREVDAGPVRIRTRHRLSALLDAELIVIPGVSDLDAPISPKLIRALRTAYDRGARLASICSGAFVLAATGLLDGHRATTHWLAAAELARRFPAIEVDPQVLYVDHGRLSTSAGAASGLDLCLHLVRRDHGAAVAADAARLSVMPLERAGGQAQFIKHLPPEREGDSLEPLLEWMRENAHRPLTMAQLARRAAMSVRSLNRHFREQTGTTPLQWLLRARVQRAQLLLETTEQSVEQIAAKAGFSSATALRQHFQRAVETHPQAYRRSFRAAKHR